MILRYENTVEDLLAFNKYQYAHSPVMKRKVRKSIGFAALAVFALVFSSTLKDGLWRGVVTGLIIASLFSLVCLILIPFNSKRRIYKNFAKGEYKLFLGKHEFEVMEEGIINRTAYSDGKMAWAAIEKIESTAEHTFIYINSTQAFLIPHTRIEEGDYKVFMTELGQHYKPNQKLQNKIRQ